MSMSDKEDCRERNVQWRSAVGGEAALVGISPATHKPSNWSVSLICVVSQPRALTTKSPPPTLTRKCFYTVRLFVRDFNARFSAGSPFVIRKRLRFPCHDSGSRAAGQAARLEEMWLSLVASRMVAKGVEEGSATMSFKGSSSPGGGSRRLLNGSSFKSAGSSFESAVVVDGDVMRYEGRRWKRVPGQSLRDRLVTEVCSPMMLHLYDSDDDGSLLIADGSLACDVLACPNGSACYESMSSPTYACCGARSPGDEGWMDGECAAVAGGACCASGARFCALLLHVVARAPPRPPQWWWQKYRVDRAMG